MENSFVAFEHLGDMCTQCGDIEVSTIAEIDGLYFDKDTGDQLFLDDENGLFVLVDCSEDGWRLERKNNLFFLVNFSVVSNTREEYIEEILCECPVFFPSQPISHISKEEALQIVETRIPQGRFLFEDENGKYIGIDNSTKNAWTEEFPSMKDCFFWLAGMNQNSVGSPKLEKKKKELLR